jgi:hypothetical protein
MGNVVRQRKSKAKQIAVPVANEKGHLFGKKNKVSVWASQLPYADIPDSYFEERFFKNNTRASNQWTDNYDIRYFRPDDLETNGVEVGLGDVKAVAGACSFSYSFILPLLSKARKKKLTEVSWLIFLYEYEYSVKISGIESDDVTTFLGAFDYRDDAENVFEAEARIAAELLLNPPEVPVESGFTFSKPAEKTARKAPVSDKTSDVKPSEPKQEVIAPRSDKAFKKPVKKVAERKPTDTSGIAVQKVAASPKISKPAPVTESTAAPKVSVVETVQEERPVAAQTVVDKPKKTSKAAATAPIADTAPVIKEAPAAKELPVVKATPVAEAAPVVKEAPAAKELPVVNELPVIKAAPVAEAAPVVNAPSVPDAAPVAKKKPAFSFAKKTPQSE